MFRRILLATDGSPRALAAARQAGLLARGLSATITVVHVVTGEVPGGFVASTPQGVAEEVLLRTRRHLGHGVTAEEERLLEGDPASEILRFATEGGYDLIILGSRKLTRWQRLLLGSVSRVVVEHAPCSVMVVRPTKEHFIACDMPPA